VCASCDGGSGSGSGKATSATSTQALVVTMSVLAAVTGVCLVLTAVVLAHRFLPPRFCHGLGRPADPMAAAGRGSTVGVSPRPSVQLKSAAAAGGTSSL
jgi:hypothetical protein